ncbi:glycoside hydrolase family 2 TIM barrel-domain containing protein [Mucilaginibacter sp.]|jgi:beta-galactosidase|uniref:glycoside hydrolase family 2 TIM barrel-domain containing protein n=1 Tax=Mucilaginibacter sp. TaxID=1882438 RepID=UPI0035617ED1
MKKKISFLVFVLTFMLNALVYSQVRSVTNFNGSWQFTKQSYKPAGSVPNIKWQPVSLPHTWNKDDVMDDTPGYYRGACWYTKKFTPSEIYRNKKLYLYFNGANQQTEVYINGKKAGSHTGGYTRFCVEIDQYVSLGKVNEIAVKVDNSFNEDIAPLTADFTFFGGIYRNVSLIAVNNIHFSLDQAANGVFITTPEVSTEKASVNISGHIVNENNTKANLQLLTTIVDREGKVVKRVTQSLKENSGAIDFKQEIPDLQSPHLWTPEDPYLYKVASKLVDINTGKVIDEVINPLGLRWFKFDGEKGFFLNGKPYKLIGASRHQDFKGLGNALPDSYHIRDVKLLKQMGGNFLRVAHYPQDAKVLAACDSLGILASVEIPVVNAITETPAFTQNCKSMLVEMIRQNFNHPSIIIWAYMNEVLLKPKFGKDKPRQQIYFLHVKELAAQLDSMVRKEDPSRYTMIACHGDYNRYKQVGIVDIPMLIGWNLYQGWYGGKTADFAKFLDKFHQDYPALPMLITEYGADADARIRSLQPERFDKSVDYAVDFHRVYLKAMEERPFVAAGIIWNLADFSSEERAETTPHINSKGLLTQDRKAKDVYLFYQANLLKQPFLKISNWNLRAGIADSLDHNVSTQPVLVFSNAKEVLLTQNGKSLGNKTIVDGVATWDIPLINGSNKLIATGSYNGKSITDASEIRLNMVPYNLHSAKATAININLLLGAKRSYTDNDGGTWLPAHAYKAGSFGYTDGKAYQMAGNGRQSYGSDRDIMKTNDDPIYQTQQVNIKTFRFDVPDGKYELVLHFAELTADKPGVALAYNLNNTDQKEAVQDRVFDVLVNNKPLLTNLNLAKQYGPLTAVKKKLIINVKGNAGITINFNPLKGEPVLNAVQLRQAK